jgi:integrase
VPGVEDRLERVPAAPDHCLGAALRRVLGQVPTVAIATAIAITVVGRSREQRCAGQVWWRQGESNPFTRNPAAGVPLPRAKAKPKCFLSHGELARLADECGDYSPLINSLGYTGLRWGEAVALQVENLDLLRRRIRVTRAMAEVRGKAVIGTPKDHERRDVPIPAFLVDDLAELVAGRSPGELVFPSPKGSILRNGNFRRNVFDAAAERAGLEGITSHGLRHTAASLAIQAGATVVVVSRMLGHSSAKVTLDVYAHLFADDLDTVADRLHEARARASADQPPDDLR